MSPSSLDDDVNGRGVPDIVGLPAQEAIQLMATAINRNSRRLARLEAVMQSDRQYLFGDPGHPGDTGLTGRMAAAAEAGNAQLQATDAALEKTNQSVQDLRTSWLQRDAWAARRQVAMIAALLVAAVPAMLSFFLHL